MRILRRGRSALRRTARPEALSPRSRYTEKCRGLASQRGPLMLVFFRKHLVRTLFSFSVVGAIGLSPTARAQSQTNSTNAVKSNVPDPTDQGWHVDVAPYLWFAGIDGTVGAAGRQSSVHVSAGDVLSYFDFGLMGAVETRYNRILIPVDFMWVRLKDNKGLPVGQAVGVQSLNVKVNEYIFTPKIGYRLVSKERFKLDALVGLRYWHVGTTLKLQPTQLGNGFNGSNDWVDAVEGARFQGMLTRKLVLTIAGDAGGGGSRLDYQVVGLLGYKLKRVTLQGGWRYLVIHKTPTSGSFVDLAQTGVVLGAVIPLK
jgi:hypothetical protein